MAADEPRKLCRTPTPGGQPTRIPQWKYDAVRAAILTVVPARAPGLALAELAPRVSATLDTDVRARLGSVGWHVICVKLEMEVAGELERVEGARPQRLLRRRR